jgi:hypothetical protein
MIRIHPHAIQRMRERGATAEEVRQTVRSGNAAPAKFGRIRFRKTFTFKESWNGKQFAHKQIDAFAAMIAEGWIVITIIVRYF